MSMHADEKSDGAIVPEKSPNNEGRLPASSTEAMEGRAPPKGNDYQTAAVRTQSRAAASNGLIAVRHLAQTDKTVQFNALLHLITVALLERRYHLGWLVNDKGIEPHVPVIDKSKREDGTFSRDDFQYDQERDCYVCPIGADLLSSGRLNYDNTYRYIASVNGCRPCPLKARCCPNTPQRKIPRSIHEAARDVARKLAETEAFEKTRRHRKKVEMAFAHLKRILRMGRLRLRGPTGAQDEFTLAAIAQNLRKMAKLTRGAHAV